MTNRNAVLLKQALLLFWAIWLTVVFTTNVLDGCKAVGLLAADWPFASGNYHFLTETTARYGTPTWLNGVLFTGVVGWEGIATLLFWLAWLRFRGRGKSGMRTVCAAFTASLGLWAAFLVADEIFIAYAVEATHLRLFIAQLATLLAVELLPEEPHAGGDPGPPADLP
jgi:hypothetical protein